MTDNSYPSIGSLAFGKLSKTEQKMLLLNHYAQREPTHFAQIDGFYVGIECDDDDMRPDDDGDCIMGGATYELMRGAEVRVLVKYGTSATQAIRLLKKITAWLEQDSCRATNGVVGGITELLATIEALDDFGETK